MLSKTKKVFASYLHEFCNIVILEIVLRLMRRISRRFSLLSVSLIWREMENFMRKIKQCLTVAVTAITICLMCTVITFADTTTESEKDSECLSLIYEYVDTINSKNVTEYISLFTEDMQHEMEKFVTAEGTQDFFKEKNVRLKNVSELSADVGRRSAAISEEELSAYEDIVVYYAELYMDVNDAEIDERIMKNGYNYRVFVMAKEDGQWKICRASAPKLSDIVEAEEGFGTKNEQEELSLQIEAEEEIINCLDLVNEDALDNGNVTLRAVPSADPTTITVYLTKSVNKNYYGTDTKKIGWTTYLRNVVPNEWTVSYYGNYPAYLQVGTMACKMYAWYYILYPKWNFAPYNANVMDTGDSDQNFVYNSYSSLASVYRNYMDEVMAYVKNTAMLSNNKEFFEVHYHATNGTQHSGTMSAAGALSLAKNNYSMYQILRYYYDYSSFIGSSRYVVLYAWA